MFVADKVSSLVIIFCTEFADLSLALSVMLSSETPSARIRLTVMFYERKLDKCGCLLLACSESYSLFKRSWACSRV